MAHERTDRTVMNIKNLIFSRITFMALAVISEIVLWICIFHWLTSVAVWIESVLHLLAVLIVLNIIRTSRHLSSDLMWIIMIMVAPVPGTLIYVLMGADLILGKTFRDIYHEQIRSSTYLEQDSKILEDLNNRFPEHKASFRYIPNQGYPFWYNQDYDYYPVGEKGWPVMLEEMKKAKKYIFMEYFIIEEGDMWNSMLEILEQKTKEGVECRVMYDDMGSFTTIPASYAKELEKKGIKAVSFNRVNPIINTFMNHRDHRKIMVIDGETAFSGGINLADEYINRKVIHGHWKDNVIRIKGQAVWSFLVTFLTNWNALRHEDDDYTVFRAPCPYPEKYDGFIAPYAQTPISSELTAQCVYEDILNSAKDYVYIMTPYLIIDSEMINTLIHTAKKGVDVRIIMPGVADKKIVWEIGRSYYAQLIQGGVKIYEYTPGFIHSKVFVSDDIEAAVGTINLDYRSLYLHFENGALLYDSKKVMDVKHDFMDTLSKCKEIQLSDVNTGFFKTFFLSVIRIFASML